MLVWDRGESGLLWLSLASISIHVRGCRLNLDNMAEVLEIRSMRLDRQTSFNDPWQIKVSPRHLQKSVLSWNAVSNVM